MNTLQKIGQLLHQKIGLSVKTVGESSIKSAVRTRMAKNNITHRQDYVNFVETSTEELTSLIEECVVPETWFFRDCEPFEYLKTKVLTLSKKYPILKLLSMPCSTGEEPYSIAMTLLEAGLKPESFKITALDISEIALASARQAVYSEYSFRGIQNTSIIDKYFTNVNSEYILNDQVKQQVKFQRSNIVDVTNRHLSQHYHVVFCRNLLIYFDNKQKELTYQNIHKMMVPGGLLIMGHAESTSTPASLFANCAVEKTFSFTCRDKNISGQEQQAKNTKKYAVDEITEKYTTKPFSRYLKYNQTNNKETIPKPTIDPSSAIEDAQTLADQGKFDLAIKICEKYTSNDQVNDEAWYLLGLINDGQGRTDYAEKYFRKTLYLNPQHYEALVHLSLLLKTNGNESAAKQMMQRANRVKKSSSQTNSASQS
ncbi:Chemotaxis protein methyltransferase CheR [hydrothermal vent metagenome]|uniref:Chemotaxis protein methyltransferase CheR n=1 Tax=hydrothermal vent metagenome TaxID=652676 RepID=A0A3B0ZJQ3_9ZZZZ